MTDEAADDTVPDKPKIRVRRPGGEWEDLPESPPWSDKPEVNAIGDLSMGEVRGILKDKTDPRHAAAVEFNGLLGERMAPLFARLGDSLYPADAVDGINKAIRKSAGMDEINEAIRKSAGFNEAVRMSAGINEAIRKGAGFSRITEQLSKLLGLHYGDLVADMLPKVPAAALPGLPGFAQAAVSTEADTAPPSDEADGVPEDQAVDLPRDQDVLASIDRTTQAQLVVAEAVLDVQGKQHTAIVQQLKTQEDQLQVLQKGYDASRADAADARREAKGAREDSKQAKSASRTANWIVGVSLVVAVLFGVLSFF